MRAHHVKRRPATTAAAMAHASAAGVRHRTDSQPEIRARRCRRAAQRPARPGCRGTPRRVAGSVHPPDRQAAANPRRSTRRATLFGSSFRASPWVQEKRHSEPIQLWDNSALVARRLEPHFVGLTSHRCSGRRRPLSEAWRTTRLSFSVSEQRFSDRISFAYG